jgi:co-chaperonin GroES (HSP10)
MNTKSIKPVSTKLDISSSQFKPLAKQYLVEMERNTESEGGIKYYIPETTWYARVVAAGDGCYCKVGERIYISQYRGENFSMSDGEFTIIDECAVLVVIDE